MIILFAAILLVAVLCLSIYLNWKIHKENKPKQNENEFVATITPSFPVIWREMEEWRRRNSTGMFVQKYNREPSETEIKTGEIQNEND
jgi:hypothetical protein